LKLDLRKLSEHAIVVCAVDRNDSEKTRRHGIAYITALEVTTKSGVYRQQSYFITVDSSTYGIYNLFFAGSEVLMVASMKVAVCWVVVIMDAASISETSVKYPT
jgi:hypothetical protein